MRPKIKHHCISEKNFKSDKEEVRSFLYTDYSIYPHTHDFYEMNIVFKGRAMHMIENAMIPVKTGDVFVIPPMTMHSYYDSEDLDVYHILLRKEFITSNRTESANMPGFLQLVEIEPFLRQNCSSSMFLHLNQNQLEKLKNDLTMICDGSEYDKEELYPIRKNVTWKILYQLSYLLYVQLNTKTASVNKYETNILRSLEYIHQHYGEKITIETLCKLTFLSRSTFLRSFEAICNCTPANYLNAYRSKKAIELLCSEAVSKTEVAHSCGFYDLSHMERTLKVFGSDKI